MKTITQKQLDDKIKLHELWLEDEVKGERLVLWDYDLSGLNLSYSNLVNSNLRYSNLSYSNLSYSDLRHSDLRDCDLRGSELRGCRFWNTIGNCCEIKTLQTGVYHVNYIKPTNELQIGCERHTVEEWLGFDNNIIFDMDGVTALNFWKEWKEKLITVFDLER